MCRARWNEIVHALAVLRAATPFQLISIREYRLYDFLSRFRVVAKQHFRSIIAD
jgi:hypothetical protein